MFDRFTTVPPARCPASNHFRHRRRVLRRRAAAAAHYVDAELDEFFRIVPEVVGRGEEDAPVVDDGRVPRVRLDR
jgi:hypothetical protein